MSGHNQESYAVLDAEKSSKDRLAIGYNRRFSPLMEKDYIEVFCGAASITIRDFCDMRIRGIMGEFDVVFPRMLRRVHRSD